MQLTSHDVEERLPRALYACMLLRVWRIPNSPLSDI